MCRLARPPMNALTSVKFAIWLYFWLLLLEGVFRKWVFPQWSDVFFLARDPVVILAYLFAWRSGLFPRRLAMMTIWLMAVCSLAFSLAGDSPVLVTLFGLRTNYLHLPLVFVMAAVLDRADVVRLGKWFIIASVPIAVLMVVQSNSPLDAWVNVGTGGVVGGQLSGALGRVRAPGPFSFILGVVSYFSLVLAFVFYGWLHRAAYSRPLVIVGSLTTLIAIPVSISRSLTIALTMVALFAGAVALRDMRRVAAYAGPLAVIVGAVILAGDTIYGQAFFTRWIEAEGVDRSFYKAVVLRILDEFTLPFQRAADAPFLGHGIGLGTVAGARLVTGRVGFLLSESELPRLVLELGPMLGFLFIGWRFWLAATLVKRGWSGFLSHGDSLGWLLAGASIIGVVLGQWGATTTLGFAVFGAGLALAALNDPTPEDYQAFAEMESLESRESDASA